jgi:putative transposase
VTFVALNQLEQEFDVEAPNQARATDITYIRTHEGLLYLAGVLDLFSRQISNFANSDVNFTAFRL